MGKPLKFDKFRVFDTAEAAASAAEDRVCRSSCPKFAVSRNKSVKQCLKLPEKYYQTEVSILFFEKQKCPFQAELGLETSLSLSNNKTIFNQTR